MAHRQKSNSRQLLIPQRPLVSRLREKVSRREPKIPLHKRVLCLSSLSKTVQPSLGYSPIVNELRIDPRLWTSRAGNTSPLPEIFHVALELFSPSLVREFVDSSSGLNCVRTFVRLLISRSRGRQRLKPSCHLVLYRMRKKIYSHYDLISVFDDAIPYAAMLWLDCACDVHYLMSAVALLSS